MKAAFVQHAVMTCVALGVAVAGLAVGVCAVLPIVALAWLL